MPSSALQTENAATPRSFLNHWLTRCGLAALVLCIAMIGGCRSNKQGGLWGQLTKTKSRPEANVPPRRAEAAADAEAYASSKSPLDDEIKVTEFIPGKNDPAIELDGATIVARVNSEPVFAEEVLSPFAKKLSQAEKDLTPEQRNQLRAQIIQANLQQHIEKAILVAAMRESMKREELKKLEEQLEKIWVEEELPRLQREYKVSTRVELERVLEEQATSLENLKPSFKSREMAMYYMGQKQKSVPKLGPKELRAYYDEHRDDFKIDAKVRWQLLQINFKSHGGKSGALTVLNQAIVELKDGTPFEAVVTKYSEGPRRDQNGVFDWTSLGSLANGQMNQALAELEVGRICRPINTGDAWVILKVLERQDEGYQEFETVQKDLANRLATEARRNAADKTLNELTAAATIWTIFDKAPAKTR